MGALKETSDGLRGRPVLPSSSEQAAAALELYRVGWCFINWRSVSVQLLLHRISPQCHDVMSTEHIFTLHMHLIYFDK